MDVADEPTWTYSRRVLLSDPLRAATDVTRHEMLTLYAEAIVKLKNLAIATSGNYRRFIIENGIKYAHHMDPKTGYPTKNNLLSASIFSRKCITSDATATGILVMGFENAKNYFNNHPELEAFIIYSDDYGKLQTFETKGLKSILKVTY